MAVNISKSIPRLMMSILICAGLVATVASGAEFRVEPGAVKLERAHPTSMITVRNAGSGIKRLNVTLTKWEQTRQGDDKFAVSAELIFYPKTFEIAPGETQVVRFGFEGRAPEKENTYILSVEDAGLSAANRDPGGGRQTVTISVKPEQTIESVSIEKIDYSRCQTSAVITNSGNVHDHVLSVILTGKNAEGREIFSQEFAGWYLHRGTSRTYRAGVPNQACSRVVEIDAEVRTDRSVIHGVFNVKPLHYSAGLL